MSIYHLIVIVINNNHHHDMTMYKYIQIDK